MENKNQLIKITVIGILIVWILPHFLRLFSRNIYFYTIIHSLIFSSVVLYLFKYYKTYGIKTFYLFIFAFGLPILLYSLDFLWNQIYYLFNTKEKEEILNFTSTFKYEGFYANMERFYSPLEYSIIDAITNKSMREIYGFIKYDRYGLALLIFCQYPVVLLIGFLKKTSKTN